jgi:DNA topoisomerase I
MRTDSLNLSDQVLGEIHDHVRERYGERYTIDKPRRFAGSRPRAPRRRTRRSGRPRSPGPRRRSVATCPEQARLYELIWKRTVATQMAPRSSTGSPPTSSGDDADGPLTFRVTGQVEKFDGFLRRLPGRARRGRGGRRGLRPLPQLEEGQRLHLADCSSPSSTRPRRRRATRSARSSRRSRRRASAGRRPTRRSSRRSSSASTCSRSRAGSSPRRSARSWCPSSRPTSTRSSTSASPPGWSRPSTRSRPATSPWCATVNRFLDEVDEWVRSASPSARACRCTCRPTARSAARRWSGCSPASPSSGSPPAAAGPTATARCRSTTTAPSASPSRSPSPTRTCAARSAASRCCCAGPVRRFYGCVDYPKCKGIRNVQQRLMYRTPTARSVPFRSPTDPERSFLERRVSRYGKPFVGSTGYPDDEFAVWSLPIATPCPSAARRCGRRPKNRKEPVAICTHPEVNTPSTSTTSTCRRSRPGRWSRASPKYDPELGGEPLETEEIPAPREQKPPRRRSRRMNLHRRSQKPTEEEGQEEGHAAGAGRALANAGGLGPVGGSPPGEEGPPRVAPRADPGLPSLLGNRPFRNLDAVQVPRAR